MDWQICFPSPPDQEESGETVTPWTGTDFKNLCDDHSPSCVVGRLSRFGIRAAACPRGCCQHHPKNQEAYDPKHAAGWSYVR